MKIETPGNVELIMNSLSQSGFESYIVGGCVRDSLIGLIPKDYDICTNALPENVISIFSELGYKTIPTGLKHGTVTVVVNEGHYEITTYRVDGNYSDGRRPDHVDFTKSLKEDLSRRDFTINAMAYNSNVGLVDYFDGYSGLKKEKIIAVGEPNDRFVEDPLRMMRAIRIASQLHFDIDMRTLLSIVRNRSLILKISEERIRDELAKILLSDNPYMGIEFLRMTHLLKIILPELQICHGFQQYNPNHDKDVYYHSLKVLENTSGKLELRLAALFHDIGKPKTFSKDENGVGHFYRHHLESEKIAKQILTRLRFDNKTIETVCILVREHMSRYDFLRSKNIKKFINRVGVENLESLFELQIADIKGSSKRNNIKMVLKLKSECEKILNEQQPLSVKDLRINGYDLINIGFPQGKEIGETLNILLEIVLEDPQMNNKEKLEKIATMRLGNTNDFKTE